MALSKLAKSQQLELSVQGLKWCRNCEEVKPVTEFYRDAAAYDGLRCYCRVCSAQKAREHSKKHREAERKYRRKWRAANPEKHASHNLKNSRKLRSTVGGKLKALLKQARKRAKAKAMAFDLNEHLDALLSRVAVGRCEATGVSLSLDSDVTRNPWAPSLDRIVSSKGYTYDNVQIVCWWYNLAKSSWDEYVVAEMCLQYTNNWRKKYIGEDDGTSN